MEPATVLITVLLMLAIIVGGFVAHYLRSLGHRLLWLQIYFTEKFGHPGDPPSEQGHGRLSDPPGDDDDSEAWKNR